MTSALRALRPDLVVLVDSSGFNIPFARRARRLGCPTLYYVSPQVWAWRTRRIHKLARWVNQLAVIFPFEPAVYAGTRVSVEYVGHPLVERLRASAAIDRDTARRELGLPAGARIVALLFARLQFHTNAIGLRENLRIGKTVIDEFVQGERLEIERDQAGVGFGQQREAIHNTAETA